MIMTKPLLALVIAMGCDPPLCHGCARVMCEGDEIGVCPVEGGILHKACVGQPLQITMDPEVRRRVREELANLMATGNAMEQVEAGWLSPVRSHGAAVLFEDLQRLGLI